MDNVWRTILWRQFGAAIEMLENAVLACPEQLWGDRTRNPEFWYVVYHTLFFLDFYLHDSEESFTPPEPFTLAELDPAGVMPDRVYSKAELLNYLEHGRELCRNTIATMTDEQAERPCGFPRVGVSVAELWLYSLRHVQHHTGQLNLILRQQTNSAPRWVSRAKPS